MRAGARPDDDAQPDYRRGPGRAERPVGMRAGDRPPSASSLCRRCGGRHETGACPNLGDDDRPPRSRARPAGSTPQPPAWMATGPRPAPHVAEDGARLARRLLAEREPAPNRSPARNEAEASLDTEPEPDDPGSEQPPF